jgi:hypothetical protein
MSSTVDALVVGRRLVDDLVAAAEKGDDAAAGALVDLASHATNAVRSFYGSPNLDMGWICEQMSREDRPVPDEPLDPHRFWLGPVDQPEPNPSPAENDRRREVIRQIAKKRQDFPVMKSYFFRREPDPKLWVKEIGLGKELPWKNKRITEHDRLFDLITRVIYPDFEEIRGSATIKRNCLETDILALDPLCLATAPKWAPLMAQWADLMVSDLEPGSFLFDLAKPRRALEKRISKARTRLKKRFPGELDFLEETKKEAKAKEISMRQLSHADLINGLAEAMAARLKSILKK